MKFLPLLPGAQNDYKGYRAVVVIVVLLAIMSSTFTNSYILA